MEPGALIPLPPPNNIVVGEFTVLIGMGGGGGGAGPDPNDCTTEGHPVDVVSGRLISTVYDFKKLYPAPLMFHRFFSSEIRSAGAMGPGWRHCYEIRMEDAGDHLRLIDETGRSTSLQKPRAGEIIRSSGLRIENRADSYVVWRGPVDGLQFSYVAPGTLLLTALLDGPVFSRRLSYLGDLLTSITDHCQRSLILEYDHRRLSRIYQTATANPNMRREVARFRYDHDGFLVTALDALGNAIHYHYQDGRLVQETGRDGYSFYFTYDNQGRCLETWGDNGVVHRRFEYDDAGGQTLVINSKGYSTVYSHLNGYVDRIIRHDGTEVKILFDAASNQIGEEDETGVARYSLRDEFGRLRKSTTPSGGTIEYAYDDRDNVVEEKTSDGATRNNQYDAQGLLVREVFGPDLTYRHEYDSQGNHIRLTTPTGLTYSYAYTSRNIPTEIRDGSGRTLYFEHDAYGNIVRLRDQVGVLAEFEHDAADRLIRSTSGDGLTADWSHDAEGRVTRYRDRSGTEHTWKYLWRYPVECGTTGDGPVRSTTRYSYDTEFCLTRLTLPSGENVDFEYNARDQVRLRRNPNGSTTEFQYDAAGRLLEVTSGDESIRVEYESGNLVAKRSSSGAELFYQYDAFGRVTMGRYGEHTTELKYSPAGRLLEEVADGETISYTYEAGRRSSVTSSRGVAVTFSHSPEGFLAAVSVDAKPLVEFTRDGRSRIIEKHCANGVVERFEWDIQDRVTSRTLTRRKAPMSGHSYEYSAGGDPLRQTDSQMGEVRFSWDGLRRPTGQHSSRPDVESATWRNDVNGNPSHLFGGRPFVYDRHDLLRDDGRYVYEYDARGRIAARVDREGHRTEFGYDLNDQLSSVLRSDGRTTRYEYDAFGRRVIKEHNGRRTRYMWDGHFLLAEWLEGDATTQYVFDQSTMMPLLEFKLDASGDLQPHYCHCDPIGALTEMTDQEADVVWAAEYDVVGGACVRVGDPTVTALRFPGQYHDAETGLSYNRHRYYDATIGRFTTPDPLEFAAGPNLYVFPGSPLSVIDLLGMAPVAFLDSSYLVSLQRAIEAGGTEKNSWIVDHAMKNKGKLEVSPAAYNEFVHSPGGGQSAKDILSRFNIQVNVPCLTEPDRQRYNQRRAANERVMGAGNETDARIAAHAGGTGTPLLTTNARHFRMVNGARETRVGQAGGQAVVSFIFP